MIQKIIKEAISLKKPLEFEYVRGDKIKGRRVGNPHCMFMHPATKNIEVHIFQTGGVSDSDLNVSLPWRLFLIDFIENVRVLNDSPSFSIAEGYNPDSSLYVNSIVKVKTA